MPNDRHLLACHVCQVRLSLNIGVERPQMLVFVKNSFRSSHVMIPSRYLLMVIKNHEVRILGLFSLCTSVLVGRPKDSGYSACNAAGKGRSSAMP